MNLPARGLAVILVAVAAILAVSDSRAANYYWAMSQPGDWSNSACWSGSSVPTSNDSAYIVNGGTVTITKSGETCLSLTLGGTGTGAIQMNSGSLFVTNPAISELIGNASPGIFAQSGGTHSIATYLLLGNDSGISGSYVLSGGSLWAPFVEVGNSGSGSFSLSAGTCSVSNELDIGINGNGSYTLNGSGLLNAKQEVVGDTAAASFTQSGGTNTVSNSIVLSQNEGSSGSYNLQGGLLSFGTLAKGPGSASFNVSGGTLYTAANSSISMPISLAAGGNANFDTAIGTLTVSTGLSGSGSLTKIGAGLLVLSGSDNYSGGTSVTAGTLVFVGANSVPTGANVIVGAEASVRFGTAGADAEGGNNAQPVPEPSTLALAAVCAAGFFVWRRFACRRTFQEMQMALHSTVVENTP